MKAISEMAIGVRDMERSAPLLPRPARIGGFRPHLHLRGPSQMFFRAEPSSLSITGTTPALDSIRPCRLARRYEHRPNNYCQQQRSKPFVVALPRCL